MLIPAMRATLTLPLLMARVLADHQDRSISADYLALLAHRLDGSSNLHCSGSRIEYRIPARPMSRTAGADRPTGPTGKDSRGASVGVARGWGGCTPGRIDNFASRSCS